MKSIKYFASLLLVSNIFAAPTPIQVVSPQAATNIATAIISTYVGFVNVKNYGADPLGVSDSTAAIRSALSNAANKVIYFPPGTYVISEPITNSRAVTLLGDAGFANITSSGVTNAFRVTTNDVTFKGLTITNFGDAIMVDNTNGIYRLRIEDCSLIGLSQSGLNRQSVNDALIDCMFKNLIITNISANSAIRTVGLKLAMTKIINIVMDNILVENITNISAGSSGITLGDNGKRGSDVSVYPTNMQSAQVSNIRIRQIHGAGETHGILVYGEDHSFNNIYIDTVDTTSGDCEGFYLKASKATLNNIHLRNSGSTSGGNLQIKGTDWIDYTNTWTAPDITGSGSPFGFGIRVTGLEIEEDRAITVPAYGVAVFCSYTTIENFEIKGCTLPSLYVPPEAVFNVRFVNGEILASRASGPNAAIYVRNTCRDIVFDNVHVQWQQTASPANTMYGALIQNTGAAAVAQSITFNNCFFGDLWSKAYPTNGFTNKVQGIYMDANSGTISNIVIRDTRFRISGDSASYAVGMAAADTNLISNVSFINNTYEDKQVRSTYLDTAGIYIRDGGTNDNWLFQTNVTFNGYVYNPTLTTSKFVVAGTSGKLQSSAFSEADLVTTNAVALRWLLGSPVAVTGHTDSTNVFQFEVPGGTIGTNGSLQIFLLATNSNNSNNKTVRVYYGGTGAGGGGTSMSSATSTTSAGLSWARIIFNTGTETNQVAHSASTSSFTVSSALPVINNFDTTTNFNVSVGVQLDNAGDTYYVYGIMAEIKKQGGL